MKVCFVTHNYPPEAVGGTEQVVTALTRELRHHGATVVVVTGIDRPLAREVDIVEHEGVLVHRLTRPPEEHDRHGILRPRILRHLRTIFEEHRPDVVHVHSYAAIGVGIAALCRELGIRTAVTFHDLWVTCARFFRLPFGGVTCPTGTDRTPCITCVNDALQTDPALIEAGLADRDRLLRAELALVDAATAPSATAATFVRECVPFERPIEVIPHGLLHAVPASHRALAWQPGTPLRIGTFGGLVAPKGVRELVAAAAGLPCELHLSGPFHDPVFQAEVVALAAKNGTKLVTRPRYAPDDRHPARDLHLAVFPSKCQETYGLVVDEALAHGVPVVVSDAGALRERAGSPGVVVTPLPRLAAVLRELVASPGRIADLRAAIPATLPTIETSALRHLELYSRLR